MDLSGPKKHKSYNNGPEALRDRIHPENLISYWIFAVSNKKIQVKKVQMEFLNILGATCTT